MLHVWRGPYQMLSLSFILLILPSVAEPEPMEPKLFWDLEPVLELKLWPKSEPKINNFSSATLI